MNNTWFEKGEEKGLQRGEEIGCRKILRQQIEKRFGPMPPKAAERLQQMPMTELLPLGDSILQAQSLSDLGLDK